jgi:acyl-CoA reductase-like NAD-dependent aldehyde dehydrogenase
MADWAARKPRERSEVLRKAWELMTARLDHFARLITLENGKAGATRWARQPMPPSSSAGSPRKPCAPTG